MDKIGRQSLPHTPPWRIDPAREIFFITICARDRLGEPLLETASSLLEAIAFYNDAHRWWVHLAVVMPDHMHVLARFPEDGKSVEMVRAWKRWTTNHLGIRWQRDYFDHRIRQEESLREKAEYILQNPVRAGLVTNWQHWPHIWMAEGFLHSPR